MSNTTAIVTRASRGIGRATAIRLAKDFSALALAARGKDNLQKVAGEVEKAGAQAIVLDLNLADPSAGNQVVEQALKASGRIDAVLNIAGAVPQVDIFEMTDQQWHDGAELKLHGARRLTIAAWPSLKESRGSVVWQAQLRSLVTVAERLGTWARNWQTRPSWRRWIRTTRSKHWMRSAPRRQRSTSGIFCWPASRMTSSRWHGRRPYPTRAYRSPCPADPPTYEPPTNLVTGARCRA